jgi:hypothetical protein
MAEHYDTDILTPFNEKFLEDFHGQIGAFTVQAAVGVALIREALPGDDFGNGETAKLHDDLSPPGLGGIALDGKFNRQPVAA